MGLLRVSWPFADKSSRPLARLEVKALVKAVQRQACGLVTHLQTYRFNAHRFKTTVINKHLWSYIFVNIDVDH